MKLNAIVLTTLIMLAMSASAVDPSKATVVSAASFALNTPLAPASLVAGFTDPGVHTMPAGTRVWTTAAGNRQECEIFFANEKQANFLLPNSLPKGEVWVEITDGVGHSSTATVTINSTAPGIFSANASGQGVAAAQVFAADRA